MTVDIYNKGQKVNSISEFTFTEEDMGLANITCDVKYPASVTPDFDLNWHIDYRGERFFLATLTPPAIKSNSEILYRYSLTFVSERTDLQRYDMLDLVKANEEDFIPNRYDFAFDADISQFADRFNANLRYNFGDRWEMRLHPSAESKRATVSCANGVKLWDILTQVYTLYTIRWYIAPEKGKMVIFVGYPPVVVDHVFEYDADKDENGITGGLYSIERTNPNDKIYTRLRGRGGSRNLPYRYFKGQSKVRGEEQYPADPDYNEFLKTSYFPNLMPKAFREYMKGYNGDIVDNPSPAFLQGRADADRHKPNPIDYAISPKENKWGVWYGGLTPNEDIYPTIQNVWDAKLGRLDEIVDATKVTNDVSEDYIVDIKSEALVDNFASAIVASGAMDGKEVPRECHSRAFPLPLTRDIKMTLTNVWLDENNYDVSALIDGRFSLTVNKITITGKHADGGDFLREKIFNYRDPMGKVVTIENIPPLEYGRITVYFTAYASPTVDKNWRAYLSVSNVRAYEHRIQTDAVLTDPDKLGDRVFYIWIKDLGFDLRDKKYWALDQGDMAVMFSDGLLAGEDYEFTIAAEKATDVYTKIYITEDTSKSIDTVDEYGNAISVSSKWRVALIRSDVEMEASQRMLPNLKQQAKAGDHFFLINIQLPQRYVDMAEARLQNYLEAELAKMDDEYSTFAIKPSAIFCATFPEVDKIKAGAQLKVHNQALIGDGSTSLYITSLSLTHRADRDLPEWDVVVSDKPNPTQNPIQMLEGTVDILSQNVYSSKQAFQEAIAQMDRHFLRSDGKADVSTSPTIFKAPVAFDGDLSLRNVVMGGSLVSRGFVPSNYGWGIYRDETGRACAEFDKVIVRGELKAHTATINQTEFMFGKKVFGQGGFLVNRVEKIGKNYKLFFDTENGDHINPFQVGDKALSENFNNYNATSEFIKYYWADVIEVGTDYIVLSFSSGTDHVGGGIPMVGDKVVQFGNKNRPERQTAFVIDQLRGGEETQYARIGDPSAPDGEWSLKDRAYVGFGYDPSTKEAKHYVYGDAFIGDRHIDDPNSTWMTFQKKVGTDRRRLYIKGCINMTSDSTGLSNLAEFKDLSASVEKVSYLQKVFPDQIFDNNGVTLAQLIAVKDAPTPDANIVAGLYGGGVEALNNNGYKDATYGVLMAFFGATNIEGARLAKTRIYSGGHIECGDMSATGSFKTYALGSLLEIQPATEYNTAGMYIYEGTSRARGVTDYELTTVFNSEKIASINDLYAGGDMVSIPITSINKGYEQTINRPLSQSETVVLGRANVKEYAVVEMPEMGFNLAMSRQGANIEGGMASISIAVYVGDVLFGEGTLMPSQTLTTNLATSRVTLPARNIAVKKGLLQIKILINAKAVMNKFPYMVSVASVKVSPARIFYEKYLSRYFANGLVLGTSGKNYFTVINQDGGLITRSTNDKYGFNVTPSGLQVKINGTWYDCSRDSAGVMALRPSTIKDI